MRLYGWAASAALAVAWAAAPAPLNGAGFGTVIAIGGQASDLALDTTRGVVYVANFTGNTIDVVSLADNTIHTSLNVPAQPGALALSMDAHYLLVTAFGNWSGLVSPSNLITLIDLTTGAMRTLAMGASTVPLGAAFLANGQALVVTNVSFMLVNPATGAMQTVTTFADLGPPPLPAPSPTFPPQILQAALAASADGNTVWGLGGAGTGAQVIFQYRALTNQVASLTALSSPALLPRVSVSADGTQAMIGYALFGSNFTNGVVTAQYPDPVGSKVITGSVIDSVDGIIYAQIPDSTYPTVGLPFSGTNIPVLSILSATNLTRIDKIVLPEDIVGRAVLSPDEQTIYAVSESGMMVLPVGSLNQYPRLAAGQEDILVQTAACTKNLLTQTLTISDPGGNSTDFAITTTQAGVTIAPNSGKTPATVQVSVTPQAFQSQLGTTVIPLTITSKTAVNLPPTVRLLVDNPGTNQRGTVVDSPGRLSDMLADPLRNMVYVLRQDKNELLVYNGTNYTLVATLATGATPTRMNFAEDGQHLLVGHDNAQFISIFDMNALAQSGTIPLPFGSYARSVAASNASTLAVARNAADFSASGGTSAWVGPAAGPAVVERLDTVHNVWVALPALGIWDNSLTGDATLAPAANGASILLADSNGMTMLYSAASDTFVAARQDFSVLSGAIAASSYNSFVVGDNVLDGSLVPVGTLDISVGPAAGFAFVNQGGFLVSGPTASAPGAMEDVPTVPSGAVAPTQLVEAPVASGVGNVFMRTVSPLGSGTNVIALTTSGLTVVAWNYDAPVTLPTVTSVVSAADGSPNMAPGGLISILGTQMSPVTVATSQIPLPTALAQSCVLINGAAVPLIYVSSQQINAQLPNNVTGSAALAIVTPGGESDTYYFNVASAAPSIFMTGTAGPLTGLATVVRWNDGALVTPTNPIHPTDYLEIYLTGMGATAPTVNAGMPGPSNPLALVEATPTVTLGGAALEVLYAGMAPGEVGVYQVDVWVPEGVPVGMSIPLQITQGGAGASVDERVVN